MRRGGGGGPGGHDNGCGKLVQEVQKMLGRQAAQAAPTAFRCPFGEAIADEPGQIVAPTCTPLWANSQGDRGRACRKMTNMPPEGYKEATVATLLFPPALTLRLPLLTPHCLKFFHFSCRCCFILSALLGPAAFCLLPSSQSLLGRAVSQSCESGCFWNIVAHSLCRCSAGFLACFQGAASTRAASPRRCRFAVEQSFLSRHLRLVVAHGSAATFVAACRIVGLIRHGQPLLYAASQQWYQDGAGRVARGVRGGELRLPCVAGHHEYATACCRQVCIFRSRLMPPLCLHR